MLEHYGRCWGWHHASLQNAVKSMESQAAIRDAPPTFRSALTILRVYTAGERWGVGAMHIVFLPLLPRLRPSLVLLIFRILTALFPFSHLSSRTYFHPTRYA